MAEALRPPGGYVVLNPDVGLFSMLSGGFRYVSAVMDDPDGVSDIAETAPFRWPRPVDFMEWLYAPEHRQWWVPVPYLVRDGAVAIGMWSLSDRRFSRLSRPELRLDRLLRPRADVVRRPLSVRVTAEPLRLGEAGAARRGAGDANRALERLPAAGGSGGMDSADRAGRPAPAGRDRRGRQRRRPHRASRRRGGSPAAPGDRPLRAGGQVPGAGQPAGSHDRDGTRHADGLRGSRPGPGLVGVLR